MPGADLQLNSTVSSKINLMVGKDLEALFLYRVQNEAMGSDLLAMKYSPTL